MATGTIKTEQIRKNLDKLSVDELLKLEEAILDVLKKKIKETEKGNWKEDFLKVSEWSHLDDENQVKVDGWKIETSGQQICQ